MRRTDRRSDCPINFALQVFGDSWSLLVIRDLMFSGKRTYAEFAQSEERISTNVLASRLKRLVEAGILRKDGRGRATRYSLTERGLDLLPLLLEMILWSARHDPETAAPAGMVQRIRDDRDGVAHELRARLSESHLPEGAA